jgi:hypothetical protein
MRILVLILAAIVFVALWLLDPVALAQLGYACALGHCGVRSRTLAAMAVVLVALLLAAEIAERLRRRQPPPPAPKVKRPRAASPPRPRARRTG